MKIVMTFVIHILFAVSGIKFSLDITQENFLWLILEREIRFLLFVLFFSFREGNKVLIMILYLY
jgi:hypothetical protein